MSSRKRELEEDTESEPPKKWTKKEEKDLWEGVTQCKTKDVMTAVRKQVDRESDPRKKIELMKKKLGWFPNGTSKSNWVQNVYLVMSI